MRAKTLYAVVLVTAVALSSACHRLTFLPGQEPEHKPVVCEGRYALCTSAACAPLATFNPKTGKVESTSALCECAVANGPSLGDLSCADRAPQGKDGNLLVSTYSFGETATHPAMTCAEGSPWAFCYDQPCVVDPKDPTKARCTCPLRTSGEYATLGGACDKAKCATTIWSAAAPDAMKEASNLLAKDEGLKAVPANSCQ